MLDELFHEPFDLAVGDELWPEQLRMRLNNGLGHCLWVGVGRQMSDWHGALAVFAILLIDERDLRRLEDQAKGARLDLPGRLPTRRHLPLLRRHLRRDQLGLVRRSRQVEFDCGDSASHAAAFASAAADGGRGAAALGQS